MISFVFVFVFGFVDDFFSFSQAHDDFEARTGEAYVSSVVNFWLLDVTWIYILFDIILNLR